MGRAAIHGVGRALLAGACSGQGGTVGGLGAGGQHTQHAQRAGRVAVAVQSQVVLGS